MITRFVAIGDSFTEGYGDDDPGSPNGVRGWADRTAEQLSVGNADFGYANLAIRGKLLDQVLAEQVDAALALEPDVVSFYAGGNDLMRPKVDIDALAVKYEKAMARFVEAGARVVMFTGVDGGSDPVFKRMRGRTAIFNEHIRPIAACHDAVLVDMWPMHQLKDRRMWAADRLHLNDVGHNEVAIAVLDALGVAHSLLRTEFGPVPPRTSRQERAETMRWAKEHAVPWVKRRLRGESSGDDLAAKRPTLLPVSVR
jgi:lysophospholipase L1-like esterase